MYDKIQIIKDCRELKSKMNTLPFDTWKIEDLQDSLLNKGFTNEQLNEFLKTGGGLKEAKDFVERCLENYTIECECERIPGTHTMEHFGGAITIEEALEKIGRNIPYYKKFEVRGKKDGILITVTTNQQF